MIQEIIKAMVPPLWILFCIMIVIGSAERILDYFKEKKYITALIGMVIMAALAWPSAIIVAIYVGYKMSKQKREEKTAEKKEYTPSSGSNSDYERWKAEREQK